MPRLAGAAPPNTARARFGATWRMPLLEIALVLFLGVGDAAERATRGRCRSAPASARPVLARHEAGVLEREPAGDQAELAEPVELAGGLGRHPGERVEVVDLGGDLRAERDRVEPVDPLDRGARRPAVPARNASRPVPIAVMTPMPGDPDPSTVAHVDGFVGAGVRTGRRRRRRIGDAPRRAP